MTSNRVEDPAKRTKAMSSVGKRRLVVLGVIALEVVVGLLLIYQLYAFKSFSWRNLLRRPNASDSVGYSAGPQSVESTAGTLSAEETSVPDVVTLALTEAIDGLQKAGLKLGKVTRIYLDGLKPGTVYQQSPASGSAAGKGSSVDVTLCAGPSTVSVPDVAGQPLSQAKQTLASAGLVPGTIAKVSDAEVKYGLVISLGAAESGTARRGEAIDLIVSSGRPSVPMPDLVGLTGDAAVATAARLDLKTTLRPDGADPGIVYRQDPHPGSAVRPESSVSAWVDQPPSSSFSTRLTSLDARFEDYNKTLGAHITCTSTSSDDRGITSYSWVATGVEDTFRGHGRELSFIMPGYRPYGSVMVVLTVTDASGQTRTSQRSIRMNWSAGTLQ